ncbi:MAG: ZIP family metal transporter, partial [Clostridia bacterium]|nr:ZIP family metal transporter [Clostridia bacterium]
GVLGTGIGGILGVSCKEQTKAGDALSLAGGVMIGVVAFEMLPEAVTNCNSETHFGSFVAVLCTLATVALSGLLEFALSKARDKRVKTPLDIGKTAKYSVTTLHGESTFQEVEVQSFERVKKRLKQAGIVTLVAIMLHNIPEGMAIGASGAASVKMGVLVTVIIGIHNIPEGMAITAPLVGGGVKPVSAVLLAFLAGSTTLVGGIIGATLGEVSPLVSGLSLAFASGVMLYVACFELLPSATKIGGKFHSISFFFGVAVSLVLSVLL